MIQDRNEPSLCELRAELARLRRVDSLGHITASLAHDLNNMLTPIVCAAGALAGNLDAHTREASYAREIQSAAARARTLVATVLAYLRLEERPDTRVRLADALEGIRPLLERIVGDGVEVVLALDGSAEITVEGGWLEPALLNLAANARDAMPNGGRVTVTTHRVTLSARQAEASGCPCAGEYVALTVTDDGAGMSPEVAARAFDPFFTTKEAGRGTGLGLASVQRFVRQSGGCMDLITEPGLGTSVLIYLPA